VYIGNYNWTGEASTKSYRHLKRRWKDTPPRKHQSKRQSPNFPGCARIFLCLHATPPCPRAGKAKVREVRTSPPQTRTASILLCRFDACITSLTNKLTFYDYRYSKLTMSQIWKTIRLFFTNKANLVARINFLEARVNSLEEERNLPSSTTEGKRCAVCLEDLNTGWLARTPCWHIYHIPCALSFMRYRRQCPVCRDSLESCSKIFVRNTCDS
jgi:hypothetical protein